MQPVPRSNPSDPDANLIVYFKNLAILNPSKTATAGRPMYDDMEVCIVQAAGSRTTVTPHPAWERSHWSSDPLTGEQTAVTYAERFARQYQQFKQKLTQTLTGTPLDHALFLTEARRAELRALNVHTVEQLASLDGQELKNLGQGGRDLKNKAMEFLEEAKRGAPNTQ